MRGKEDQAPELYLIAGCGGRAALRGIGQSPLRERLLIRNDHLLRPEEYGRRLVNRLIFFAPKEQAEAILEELVALFPLEALFANPKTGESEPLKVMACPKKERFQESPKAFLEIHKKPYRIPIQLELVPYQGQSGYPQEAALIEGGSSKDAITYCKFNDEEYLARSFYRVINDLEWLDDLLWYQEIYDILSQKAVNGRKVWDSLRRLLTEQPIPFLRNRLERIKGYEAYAPMVGKWQALHEGSAEGYPKWEEAIALLAEFFSPIFQGILKDEIFFGDWMPQLKRYL